MASAIGTGFGEVGPVWEDFVKDPTGYNETEVSGATQDVTNKHGGWWRQVMGGDNADAALFAAERMFEVDEGFEVNFEVGVRSSTGNTTAAFFGLTDDPVESLAVIIENEGGNLNSVAADAVGFLIEGPTDLTWQAAGVQNDVDNSLVALTEAADFAANVTQYLRMELNPNDSGTVLYHIDGDLVATQTAYFRSSILFCPAFNSDDRGIPFNLDVDFMYCSAPRSLG